MVVPVPPPVAPVGLPGAVVPVVPPPPAPGVPFGGWKGFLLPKTSNVSSGADAVVVVVGLAVVGVVIGGGSATLLPLPEPPSSSGRTTKNRSIATARKPPRKMRTRRFGSFGARDRSGAA